MVGVPLQRRCHRILDPPSNRRKKEYTCVAGAQIVFSGLYESTRISKDNQQMDEALVRCRIPRDLGVLLDVESRTISKSAAFTETFLKNSIEQHEQYDLKNILSHKAVTLSYTRARKERGMSSKRAKGLSAKQKRAMKIFQIRTEHQRYELFLPLHDLWRQYIVDLCGGLKPTSSPQFVQQKLLKADFHGAIITVVRSRCPSYVGTTGILVQEFKHVFKIITKEDKMKVIPKKKSMFSVEIDGFISHIYGNKFEQRASERSAKKFKVRGTIDL
ncbi:ribonuclease P protein subunit p29 [Aulostomus maculatus]